MFSGLEVIYFDINVSAPLRRFVNIPRPLCRCPERKLSGGVVSRDMGAGVLRTLQRVCRCYVGQAQEIAEWPAIHSYRTGT